MVFPSLVFHVEPGMVSQVSAVTVLIFSFCLYRIKKIILFAILLLVIFFGVQQKAHAYAVSPSYHYGQWPPPNPYANNYNYYGRPWGSAPPVYFYPQLPYHSFWGPQQNYFNPHTPSPYAPTPYCPFCGGNQPTAPQFPFPVYHPGGGVS